MALDDFLESEVGIAAAATAVAFSPRARRVLRRGAVLGLAGAIKAADAIGALVPGHEDDRPDGAQRPDAGVAGAPTAPHDVASAPPGPEGARPEAARP